MACNHSHHSSEQMNFTVGFRPLDIVFVYSATQIWGIFVHTELVDKMGWLEYILVTPSHHRIHHASNPRYLDKNMGMFLIVRDQLFGTFQPELPNDQYQPKKYGLTKPMEKTTPLTIIFHEWAHIRKDLSKKDIGWRTKWNYLFGPSGWSHDGSRLTSEQLRQEESTELPESVTSPSGDRSRHTGIPQF
jgi:sterol desaturase/sphingolipid hydroxylase (fatty acid hydroxylase superfamily)